MMFDISDALWQVLLRNEVNFLEDSSVVGGLMCKKNDSFLVTVPVSHRFPGSRIIVPAIVLEGYAN